MNRGTRDTLKSGMLEVCSEIPNFCASLFGWFNFCEFEIPVKSINSRRNSKKTQQVIKEKIFFATFLEISFIIFSAYDP